jgi:hypothetical protein
MAASLIGLRAKNFQACITTKKPQMAVTQVGHGTPSSVE